MSNRRAMMHSFRNVPTYESTGVELMRVDLNSLALADNDIVTTIPNPYKGTLTTGVNVVPIRVRDFGINNQRYLEFIPGSTSNYQYIHWDFNNSIDTEQYVVDITAIKLTSIWGFGLMLLTNATYFNQLVDSGVYVKNNLCNISNLITTYFLAKVAVITTIDTPTNTIIRVNGIELFNGAKTNGAYNSLSNLRLSFGSYNNSGNWGLHGEFYDKFVLKSIATTSQIENVENYLKLKLNIV